MMTDSHSNERNMKGAMKEAAAEKDAKIAEAAVERKRKKRHAIFTA